MKTILLLAALTISTAVVAQTGNTCGDPIPLQCDQTYIGSTASITNDNATSGANICNNSVGLAGQVWYSYTAISNGTMVLSTVNPLTEYNSRIHVFTGSCGDLICHSFSTPQSALELTCVVGTTYLIRVGGVNVTEGNYELTVNCDLDMFGCTDSNAHNYSEIATVDDGSCCYDYFMNFHVSAGNFANEIAWDLLDAGGDLLASGGSEDQVDLCMPEGACGYFLIMTDAFGDGWNGGQYSFTDGLGNTLYTGTMESGSGPDTVLIPIGNGDCPFGCTNPIADNYDPEAGFNDGSCIIPGCVDENAQNYDPVFTEDDGSCLYNVNGYAFVDSNENAFFDEFEVGLAGVPISLMPDNLTTFSNSNGYFEFPGLINTDHWVSQNLDDANWPVVTTNSEFNTAEDDAPYYFGFSTGAPFLQVDLETDTWGFFFCGQTAGMWITLENNGNEVINSTVEIDLDEMLAFTGETYVYAGMPGFSYTITPNGDNMVYSFENILPSGHVYITIDFEALAPEFIGQTVTNTFTINSESTSGLIDNQVLELEELLECSYDPNDITATPAGYTDQNYILNDTPLEYRIRFQNTGNAPAFDIFVSNAIDENLDLGSFELAQTSHDVVTTINYETREVLFTFNQIMLPDSFSDEVGSHGFIIYRINPLTNLAVGTVIENTAGIIFDINEPVITNTAFNTITTCDGIATFQIDTPEVCAGEYVMGSASSGPAESYTWTIDGTEVSSGTNLYTAIDEPGTYDIILSVTSPLCEATNTGSITVHGIENPSFTQDGNVLTADGGTNYQWFFNGVAMDGETGSTLNVTASGNYSVQSTSDFGCIGMSPESAVVVSSIESVDMEMFTAFPNPTTDNLNISFNETGIHFVKLMGADGKCIRDFGKLSNNLETINMAGLSQGIYVLRVVNERGDFTSVRIAVK